MKISRFIRPALALLFGALFVVPFGTVANAAEPDCKTVVSHLVNRPDNGHGTPSVWALDAMDRTVKVCHEPEVVAKSVEVQSWTYTAELTDTGTFVTQGSAHGSPNDGLAITGGRSGTVAGKATFSAFTAPAEWQFWSGDKVNGKTFQGTQPSGTGDWIKNLFSDGLGQTGITTYSWTYKTCTEQWVDSSDKANDDGQSETAGDITGKPCPSPSAVPSVSNPAPGASPAAEAASLPVTGNRPWLYAAAGFVALLAGGFFVYTGRSKRRQFKA